MAAGYFFYLILIFILKKKTILILNLTHFLEALLGMSVLLLSFSDSIFPSLKIYKCTITE